MINNITIMGRLTADPDIRQTPNGISVVPFAVAVDRKYTPSGQERKTDFINCVAWRSTAEFISKYFNKGDLIALEGELQTRNYEDKNGNKRTAFEVIVSNVSFCGGKRQTEPQDEPTLTNVVPPEFEEYDDDEDLPF